MNAEIKPDVVTVTLNPAIDLTVALERFTLGAVQKATSAVSTCGGKGVNVAGCLADWGANVAVTGVLGRANDSAFAEFFAQKGILDRLIRTAGETRTNIKISDRASGETTDVNLPGLDIPDGAFEAVRATLQRSVTAGQPVVLAGSLPERLPNAAWATLAADLARYEARVVLDSSGPALTAALESGAPIHAIKPNKSELEALIGRDLRDGAEIVAAARRLIERGVSLVAVSLGAEGALFIDKKSALKASLPAKAVLSTVGAGDAMVAGLVAGLIEGATLSRIARLAVAFATSKLDRIGPFLGSNAEIETLAAAVQLTAGAN